MLRDGIGRTIWPRGQKNVDVDYRGRESGSQIESDDMWRPSLECRSDLCTTCSSDERYDGAL